MANRRDTPHPKRMTAAAARTKLAKYSKTALLWREAGFRSLEALEQKVKFQAGSTGKHPDVVRAELLDLGEAHDESEMGLARTKAETRAYMKTRTKLKTKPKTVTAKDVLGPSKVSQIKDWMK